jgi:hypothetical protein
MDFMLAGVVFNALGSISGQEIIVFIVSAVVGVLLSSFFAGEEAGEKGKLGLLLRIHVNDYVFHVHHWFYAAAIMIALPSSEPHKSIVYGFLVGIFVHGLTYKDFHKIIYKEEIE